jgi:hypothetical protein
MAERAAYYDRIRLAIENPKIYLSMISDGMAQIHCELPYFGNMHQYSKTIPQHLQGILCHGRSMYIYRTFGNFKGGEIDFLNGNYNYKIYFNYRCRSSTILLVTKS